MTSVTKKFAGLNKTSTKLAEAVPDFDGKTFQEHWNDRYSGTLSFQDHNPYAKLNLPRIDKIERYENLSKAHQDALNPSITAVAMRTVETTNLCECKPYTGSCKKCASELLEDNTNHVGKFVETTSKITHFFTLGNEAEANKFIGDLERIEKKKKVFALLNNVNNGLMTPWGAFFGNPYLADNAIAGEIRHVMNSYRHSLKKSEKVVGGRKELKVCEELFNNNDFRHKEKWLALASSYFESHLDSISKYEKEVTRGRTMQLEFSQMKKILGKDSQLISYLTNELKGRGLSIDDILNNAESKVAFAKTGISNNLKEIAQIIENKETAGVKSILTKPDHIDHVKSLYEIEWRESWGPLPAYVHYYI